jgi:hypothetical protein
VAVCSTTRANNLSVAAAPQSQLARNSQHHWWQWCLSLSVLSSPAHDSRREEPVSQLSSEMERLRYDDAVGREK